MLKKFIAPVLLGGALAGGVVGGVATAGIAAAATPAASTAASNPTSKGEVGTWLRAHRKEIRRAGVQLSAKSIGITSQTLRSDLKAGNSIAGVATQHNVNPQTVITALVNAVDGKINQAVTAHKLTAAQAAAIEAKVPARVTKIVNHTF